MSAHAAAPAEYAGYSTPLLARLCAGLTIPPQTTADWRKLRAALAAPFLADEVDFRADSKPKNGDPRNMVGVVAYVDRFVVARRLDEVCGVENWTYEPVVLVEQQGRVTVVKGLLTIFGVTKASIGDSDVNGTEPSKTADSDGLKRVAALWGVGAYLAELARPRVSASEGGYLSDAVTVDLRKRLARGDLWKTPYARDYYAALVGAPAPAMASAPPLAPVDADQGDQGAPDEGRAEGRADGRAEGRADGSLDLARVRALALKYVKPARWEQAAEHFGGDLDQLRAWAEGLPRQIAEARAGRAGHPAHA